MPPLLQSPRAPVHPAHRYPHCVPQRAMKGKLKPTFIIRNDTQGLPYFSANIRTFRPNRRPAELTRDTLDACTFLDEKLRITPKATGIFSTDLTSRDDVLLAILSLLLILVIEALLTTVLLRTTQGAASNLGFSVKHFIELARQFRPQGLIRGRQLPNTRRRKINYRLLFTAAGILLTTFAAEVVVLYLTSPYLVMVTNRVATFQLVPAVSADWHAVEQAAAEPFDRPCFDGVEMGEARMLLCLTSNVSNMKPEPFARAESPVRVRIVSETHDFGTEHTISIGKLSAVYSARGYFLSRESGGSGGSLMKHREQFYNRDEQIFYVHKMYVAYLFSAYARTMKDGVMNFERLQDIDFDTKLETRSIIDLIKVNNVVNARSRQTLSVRHTTTFTAVAPSGITTLQLAAAVLRASTAVAVSGPDMYDLGPPSGNTLFKELVTWEEQTRTLNWLSVSILLLSAISALVALRPFLKPIATWEIAGVLVEDIVGAKRGRSPALLANDEKKFFNIEQMVWSSDNKLYETGSSLSEDVAAEEWSDTN